MAKAKKQIEHRCGYCGKENIKFGFHPDCNKKVAQLYKEFKGILKKLGKENADRAYLLFGKILIAESNNR